MNEYALMMINNDRLNFAFKKIIFYDKQNSPQMQNICMFSYSVRKLPLNRNSYNLLKYARNPMNIRIQTDIKRLLSLEYIVLNVYLNYIKLNIQRHNRVSCIFNGIFIYQWCVTMNFVQLVEVVRETFPKFTILRIPLAKKYINLQCVYKMCKTPLKLLCVKATANVIRYKYFFSHHFRKSSTIHIFSTYYNTCALKLQFDKYI